MGAKPMSSCFETVDNGVITRHYTGDVTIDLTSANTGAGYVPPACSQQHAALSAPEPGALALFVFGFVVLVMNRVYRRAIRS
jgi:hypothetical protein